MFTVPKTLTSQRSEWLLVGATIGLSALLIAFGRGGTPQVGETRSITVSVVPADKRGLGCAHAESIEGASCAYATVDKKARPRKLPERERLAPYVTTSGELVILAGVFAGDSVERAVEQRRRTQKNRFNITCDVKLLAQLPQVPIRFSVRDEFKPADVSWVGQASDCVAVP